MNVEVAYLPPMATGLDSKLCVVIDVLRATSTLVAMFEAGARRVMLAESVAGALDYAARLPERPKVCGESGGLPPAGFDYGNSPREFRGQEVAGRDFLMCTSNGTKAMRLVSEAPVVLAGSLFNGSAVARRAVGEARERGLDIVLVCSGDYHGSRFAIDDAFCAGYLVTRIRKEAGEDTILDESAVSAVRLYRSYLADSGVSEDTNVPPRQAILGAFWDSHNAAVLRQVGLAEDVEYCSQLDISACVPRLVVKDVGLELECGH